MHKGLLPLAAALVLVPALGAGASEFPGVDHFCYWINNSGQILNLDSVCGVTAPPVLPPVALSAETAEAGEDEAVVELGFEGSMRAAGYSLMTGNLATSAPTVHYDVWKNRDGLDYLYFMWGSSPGSGMDNRSEPEVVVQFLPSDKVARVSNDVAQACFFSSGPTCNTASLEQTVVVPTHRRSENYPGNCMFPWQSASDGSRCGGRAAVVREGGL